MLTVDHGFNSSTFTAQVIASAGADAAEAVVGAGGDPSGPHGGATSRALATFDSIGPPERAEEHIRGMLARGERIMGIGVVMDVCGLPRAAGRCPGRRAPA